MRKLISPKKWASVHHLPRPDHGDNRRPSFLIRERHMTALKSLTAAALLLIVPIAPSFAQFSEPAAFASQHPDRDVLNGGRSDSGSPRGANGLDNVKGLYNWRAQYEPPACAPQSGEISA